MEAALAARGLPRGRSEPPGEYSRRVRDALSAVGPAVARLTGLYEQARFDTAPVDASDAAQARAALAEAEDVRE